MPLIRPNYIFLFLFCFSSMASAQDVLQPTVKDHFGKMFLNDNFDSISNRWSVQSTSDNLLLVQDGEMVLHRRATTNPYAVMGHFENTLSTYRLVTSIKLMKAGDDGSIGVIFMAQPGGQGGFIFEINGKQQYRLRQLKGNIYRYLSGEAKTGGWVKNEFIKGNALANLVEVRTSEKQYDLYLNSKLIQSFSEISYKYGDFGYLIGPSSKGSVDFIYLFTDDAGKSTEDKSSSSTTTSPSDDVAALAESVISLKTQLNKVNEKNEELRQIIASLRAESSDDQKAHEALEDSITSLQFKLRQSHVSYDSLLKVNSELMKYKELVNGNDNGDLVISLSKNLKNLKLRNEQLENELKSIRDTAQKKSAPAPIVPVVNRDTTTAKEFTLPTEK